MSGAGLSVRDLCVVRDGRTVLRQVSFEARPGGLIGLIGPNGAGKTTLIRSLCRLAPVRSGVMAWNGRPLDRMAAREQATTLAYLPQGQTVQWPMTVRRVVELGRLPRLGRFSRPSTADRTAVEAAMAAVDVARLADRPIGELSGGERARALLARALAVEAPVLLADEPIASLDPYHAREVMGLLRRTADQGRLVIAVMHDLALVDRFCDRVLLLHEGRLAADDAPRAALTPDRLRTVYRMDPADLGLALRPA